MHFRRYYQSDESRLGQQLPKPRIKHTKKIGDTLIHKLSWGDEAGGEWLEEDFFNALTVDGESLSTNVSCNTRKSRDKRERRHTVGVFIGAYPCGTIVIGDELFGSEGIAQVYGLLTDFLDSLSDTSFLKQILYDDMCHLKRYAEDPKRANINDITQKLASINKHIDKFHFRNHIDKWCQKNCNPDAVPELKGVNSQVCEQLFKKINSHKNCISMNEARFGLFFLYQYELHNLDIEKMTILADPREEYRWDLIKQENGSTVQGESVEMVPEKENSPEPELEKQFNKLNIECPFKCKECGASYKKEGFLQRHMEQKHITVKETVCKECDAVFDCYSKLTRHMKTHLTCKICKEVFPTKTEMVTHKAAHSTCIHCKFDFVTMSKLTRHMETFHQGL